MTSDGRRQSRDNRPAPSGGEDADAWRAWVGRRTTTTAYLDPAQADRMAVTLDRPPGFTEGDALPPAWHWLYFHDTVQASLLGPDGHPALGVTMPPVPLERRMWAAGSLGFDGILRLGETATRSSTITSITAKEGRTGALYFVTLEHDVRVTGRPGVREEQTIVYRALAPDAAGSSAVAPTDQEYARSWAVDSRTLFRYSALTFNAHRIHYDLDYARHIEKYPGLVVHGPLIATLLMDLATERGGALKTFRYRARSPLFAPEPFTVNGKTTSTGAALWAASAGGQLAMDGDATYEEGI